MRKVTHTGLLPTTARIMHNIKNCLERSNESGVFVEIIQAFKIYGNNDSTGGATLCRHFLTFGDKPHSNQIFLRRRNLVHFSHKPCLHRKYNLVSAICNVCTLLQSLEL